MVRVSLGCWAKVYWGIGLLGKPGGRNIGSLAHIDSSMKTWGIPRAGSWYSMVYISNSKRKASCLGPHLESFPVVLRSSQWLVHDFQSKIEILDRSS